jgi:hypothetical protein
MPLASVAKGTTTGFDPLALTLYPQHITVPLVFTAQVVRYSLTNDATPVTPTTGRGVTLGEGASSPSCPRMLLPQQ